MAGMNVRRLAAIDMYGSQGSRRRRRIILVEFVVGVVVLMAFGAWVMAASSGLAGRAFGAWMIGAGVNYAPLAAHGILLNRPGALQAELAGVEVNRELRRYSLAQLWVFVPLSLVVVEVRDALARRRPRSSPASGHDASP